MASPRPIVLRSVALPEPGRRALRIADVLVEAGFVREVAAPGLMVGNDALSVDASERIATPGLANCHTHSHFAFGRGFGDRWTLETHLNSGGGVWFGADLETLRLGAMLVAAELVRSGCTSVYDMVLQAPVPSLDGMAAVASGYSEVGLRAVVAAVVADRTFWETTPGLIENLPADAAAFARSVVAPQADDALDGLRAVLRGWPFDHDRLRPAVAPTVPLLCSDAFLADVARLAREHGAPLQTHLAESKPQAIAALSRWGRSLTAQLDEAGFLGPDVSVAHAVWLDEDDVARLADRGAAVAHNPGSNMRLGNGVAPVAALRRRGARIGIGTDACSCADQQNMFEAVRLAVYASRLCSPDPDDWLGAEETLSLAARGAQDVMGFGGTGTIAPGSRADIVLLDRRDLAYVPLNDPWTQIAFSETGRAVRDVMIDGAFVYRDNRFLTFDHDALLRRAEAHHGRLAELGAERRRSLGWIEPYVTRFCVGLARHPHHVQRYIGTAGTDPAQ